MDNDRQKTLKTIARSRRATARLARLLQDPQCTLDQVVDLLDEGALVEEAFTMRKVRGSERKFSAIEVLLERDQADIVACLYRTPGLDESDKQNWLRLAISCDAMKSTVSLIKAGALDGASENEKAGLLCQAARSGQVGLVKNLIDWGCDPNTFFRQEAGGAVFTSTPLHWASTAQVAALLLDAGGNIDAINEHGYPPLHRLIDEATQQMTKPEARQDFVAAACLLIQRQAKTDLTTETDSLKWKVVDDLNRMRHPCPEIIHALMEQGGLPNLEGQVRSLGFAHSLALATPGIDLGPLVNKRMWDWVSPGDNQQRQMIENVFAHGVDVPDVFHINLSHLGAWLEIGIFVSTEQLDQLAESEMDENGSLSFNYPTQAQIAQSNAAALARQTANASSHRPRCRL